eukprot:743231_1
MLPTLDPTQWLIACLICGLCTYLILEIFRKSSHGYESKVVHTHLGRHFVIRCSKGPIKDSDVLLQDLKKCRVDLMARCINSALVKSHCIRNKAKISFLCGHNDQHHETSAITFDGDQCKHIRPDERTLGAMIKHALHHGPMTHQQKIELFKQYPKTKVLKGVEVTTDSKDFASFVTSLIGSEHVFIIHLTEQGTDINLWLNENQNKVSLSSKLIVLLGDSTDIDHKDLDQIKHTCTQHNHIEFVDVKIGNISLLSSHVIVLFHHYLDTFLHSE